MTDYRQKVADLLNAYNDEAACAYIHEIADCAAPLAKGEEALLMSAIREGDSAARERLMEAHLLLVADIAKGYLGRGLCALDLLQEGNTALMKAAEEYDPDCGRRFSLYAGDKIRHAITRTFAETCIDRHIPVEIVENINKVMQAAREQEATAEEILSDPDAVRGLLQEALEELTPREQKVIELRAGLNGNPMHSAEEAAELLGVTPARIRQIEDKAMRKSGIRNLLRQQQRNSLKDFLD